MAATVTRIVTEQICSELIRKRTSPTTPDYLKLKLVPYHLVFVYGTEKFRERNGKIFSDCQYLGTARTLTSCWEVFESDALDLPVAYYRPGARESHYIRGEVYRVPVLKMFELDDLNSNTFKMERHSRYALLEQQDVPKAGKFKHPYAPVWLYQGIEGAFQTPFFRCTIWKGPEVGKEFYSWASKRRPLNFGTNQITKLDDWSQFVEAMGGNDNDQVPFNFETNDRTNWY